MNARLLFVLCVLTLGPTKAWATDNYKYGPDEYVTIVDGISPNGKYAITAHGEGEIGYRNWGLYLTDAHTGQRFGPLKEMYGLLDTGYGSYCAIWSKDSKDVRIFFRSDRHEPIKVVTYRIENKQSLRLKGPVNVDDDYTWYWSNHTYRLPKGKTFGTPLPLNKEEEEASDSPPNAGGTK